VAAKYRLGRIDHPKATSSSNRYEYITPSIAKLAGRNSITNVVMAGFQLISSEYGLKKIRMHHSNMEAAPDAPPRT
jgi:hypothetical protein